MMRGAQKIMEDGVKYTAEMVRDFPDDGNRYETVHGVLLVTPTQRPWHQIVLSRFNTILTDYVNRHEIGYPLQSPADISWAEDILVQPDIFVVDLDEAMTYDWSLMRTLLFVGEVISETTAQADRITKRRVYQAAGVSTYWIIDPNQKFVEIWVPDATVPFVEKKTVEWHPANAPEPMAIDLRELFSPL